MKFEKRKNKKIAKDSSLCELRQGAKKKLRKIFLFLNFFLILETFTSIKS